MRALKGRPPPPKVLAAERGIENGDTVLVGELRRCSLWGTCRSDGGPRRKIPTWRRTPRSVSATMIGPARADWEAGSVAMTMREQTRRFTFPMQIQTNAPLPPQPALCARPKKQLPRRTALGAKGGRLKGDRAEHIAPCSSPSRSCCKLRARACPNAQGAEWGRWSGETERKHEARETRARKNTKTTDTVLRLTGARNRTTETPHQLKARTPLAMSKNENKAPQPT